MDKVQVLESQKALKWVDGIADLMDNRFRIPFTNIRFGLDAIIGLFPAVGDVISFAISGTLVAVMARYGASGRLLILMLGNILLDGLVGTVPIIGDLFDIGYKANRRNVNMLLEHYDEGKHRGSGKGIVLLVIFALILIFVVLVSVFWGMISLLLGN